MIKSSWSDIDRTAIDFVKSWANETEPRTSRTKVAAALGFTYQAIKKKFNYENAPLTLGEFEVDWVLFPVFYWVTGVTCD